jgi:tRNA (mo5U34)-methyltransferase
MNKRPLSGTLSNAHGTEPVPLRSRFLSRLLDVLTLLTLALGNFSIIARFPFPTATDRDHTPQNPLSGNVVDILDLIPEISLTVKNASDYLLSSAQIRDLDGLKRVVDAINKSGGTYHQLNLTEELRFDGEYDMRRYVGYYNLPADMSGLKVLDVGTASGYFALECARRGGNVVSIDIWDYSPLKDVIAHTDVSIKYVKKSIYDLDETFGQFDVVICGSLLLHLPDQYGAIVALRKVCCGSLYVSTSCPPDSGETSRPICDFVAVKGKEGDYYTFWQVSEEALRRMILTAGFAKVSNETHFSLDSESNYNDFATPHVVMTGSVS